VADGWKRLLFLSFLPGPFLDSIIQQNLKTQQIFLFNRSQSRKKMDFSEYSEKYLDRKAQMW